MDNQKRAYIYGLSTVLLWSTVATAFKLSLRYLDYIQLLLYSTIVSILVLSCILALRGKIRLLFSYSGKQYLQSMILGFLNPFLYYMVLFKAYDLLPAQEAQPLNYTWAITLALLSIPLLKQRIGIKDIFSVFVSYSGVVVISTHGELSLFQSPWCSLSPGQHHDLGPILDLQHQGRPRSGGRPAPQFHVRPALGFSLLSAFLERPGVQPLWFSRSGICGSFRDGYHFRALAFCIKTIRKHG